MTLYSEKTQRELDRYTRNLVKRMPLWLKEMFDAGTICFLVNSDNARLDLGAAPDIPRSKFEHAAKLVGKYMDKHPCPAINGLVVQ